MAWSIRNYNTFIREAKSATGLNYKGAQELYRRERDHFGRSMRGVDVSRHPIITSRLAKVIRAGQVERVTKRVREEAAARRLAERMREEEAIYGYEEEEYEDFDATEQADEYTG